MLSKICLLCVYMCACVCESVFLHISPAKSGYAMNSHTGSWILLKFLLQQVQPIFNQLTGGCSTIIKWPILRERRGTWSLFSSDIKGNMRIYRNECYLFNIYFFSIFSNKGGLEIKTPVENKDSGKRIASSPPLWFHLSPAGLCRRLPHTLEPLLLRQTASGPIGKL